MDVMILFFLLNKTETFSDSYWVIDSESEPQLYHPVILRECCYL